MPSPLIDALTRQALQGKNPLDRFRGVDSLRTQYKDDPDMQKRLAAKEHGIYTEGVVSDNPILAPIVAGAIPIYQAGKATGVIKARSPAGWDQMSEAMRGILVGLGILSPRDVTPEKLGIDE